MMDDGRGSKPSKGSTNWLLVGGALLLGYYVGKDDSSSPITRAYAEAVTPADYAAAVESLSERDDFNQPRKPSEASDDTAEISETLVEDATQQSVQPQQYAYYAPPATEPDPLAPATTASSPVAPSTSDQAAISTAGTSVAATATPWTSYQPSSPPPRYAAPSGYAYQAPPSVVPKCEGVGCYGAMSATTGLPRTTYVSGYVRKDGTYVRPHYRSRSR